VYVGGGVAVVAVVVAVAVAVSEADCAYGGGTAFAPANGQSPFQHSSRVFGEPKESS
jgi:hypothetical protein